MGKLLQNIYLYSALVCECMFIFCSISYSSGVWEIAIMGTIYHHVSCFYISIVVCRAGRAGMYYNTTCNGM